MNVLEWSLFNNEQIGVTVHYIDSGIDHTDIYYFISRNNYIYKVHYNEEKANDPNWNQHEEIINQMLSSFKFIE